MKIFANNIHIIYNIYISYIYIYIYINFLDNCLKCFSADHFHAPGESFCFDRIKELKSVLRQKRHSHRKKSSFYQTLEFPKMVL